MILLRLRKSSVIKPRKLAERFAPMKLNQQVLLQSAYLVVLGKIIKTESLLQFTRGKPMESVLISVLQLQLYNVMNVRLNILLKLN